MAGSIADSSEVLFRQIHPTHFDKGEPASPAFKPTPKDENQLSLDRSSLVSPAESFDAYCARGYQSAAVYGISVGEFAGENIPCKPDPIEPAEGEPGNPAHAVADFAAHNGSQQKIIAKRLKLKAVARGKLHPAEAPAA